MGKFVDLTGKRFGRLLVMHQIPNPGRYASRWLCLCDCGKEHSAQAGCLNAGKVTSCGCYQKEKHLKRITKHGLSRHPLNTVLQDMIKRCYDPREHNFKHYGGRGVIICDEWLKNHGKFLKWAVDHGYRKGLWIDRKAGGSSPYSPENCRFVTPKESARNQSNNRLMTLNSVTKSAAEWAEFLGVNHGSLLNRKTKGWTDEEALTIPFTGSGRKRPIKLEDCI